MRRRAGRPPPGARRTRGASTDRGYVLPNPTGANVPSHQRLRAALIGVALIAGLTLAACGGGEEAKAEKEESASAQTVSVIAARSQALPRIVIATGTVSAWEEVPVGAETGGLTATGVYADEGRYVRQGALLVKLNDDLLRAQLAQQNAALESAQALLAQEDAALARARELRERGFLSQASLDSAIAEQRTAAAQVAASRAARSETATRLDQTNIRAPVSGLIISRNVTRGQIVQPGTELFRMVRDGRLELDAQVPETDLALVRAGQSATVSSDEVGEAPGTVRIVTPEVDPETRLGIARITISGGAFRPGMFGRAEIDVGAQDAVTVPTAAILYRENRPGVFVLDAETRARFRPLTILSRGEQWSSVEGVEAGARIIVQGAGFLGEGDRVRVAAPAPARAAAPAPAAKAS